MAVKNIKIVKDIAKIVKEHRKAAGLTQNQLASLAAVGKTSIFDLERGKSTIKLNTLLAILEALSIKINFSSPYLLGKNDVEEQ